MVRTRTVFGDHFRTTRKHSAKRYNGPIFVNFVGQEKYFIPDHGAIIVFPEGVVYFYPYGFIGREIE